MIDKKKNALSIANYKDANGNLVNISTLNEEERIKYHLASLMKNVIEVLEMSIPSDGHADRIFIRAKFSIMGLFHSALENIQKKKAE